MNGIDKPVVRAETLIVKLAKGEDLSNACSKMSMREEREFSYAVSRKLPLRLALCISIIGSCFN